MSAASPLLALLRVEFLLRARRRGTLVVALAVWVLTWLMVADPASGHALMAVHAHRLAYDSATLAYGSASLGGLLLGLAGFYLARGRVQEDLRSGMAGVLAATPVRNTALLLVRALGALAYLLALAGVLMLGTWALHALRGEGPWLPWVYLQHYTLMLLPPLVLAASLATLCDAWAPLTGRRGDVLYFLLWTLLLGLLPLNEQVHDAHPSLLLDFSGLATSVNRLVELLGTGDIAIGSHDFDASLPLLEFSPGLWTVDRVALRLGSTVLALLPLLPALWLFHRYDPERVRPRSASPARGRVGRWTARLVAPATRLLGAMLPWGCRLPLGAGFAAVWAELLLSLISQPAALLWLLLAWLAPLAAAPEQLSLWQVGILAGWALWAAELGARDGRQGGTADLAAALPGGALRRSWSRWAAAWLLGLLGSATLLLRQSEGLPALAAGLAAASAAAVLLGRLSGGGRAFLALFLFWLFVAVQARSVAALDWMGFNGVAGSSVPLLCLLVALLGMAGMAALTAAAQRRR